MLLSCICISCSALTNLPFRSTKAQSSQSAYAETANLESARQCPLPECFMKPSTYFLEMLFKVQDRFISVHSEHSAAVDESEIT